MWNNAYAYCVSQPPLYKHRVPKLLIFNTFKSYFMTRRHHKNFKKKTCRVSTACMSSYDSNYISDHTTHYIQSPTRTHVNELCTLPTLCSEHSSPTFHQLVGRTPSACRVLINKFSDYTWYPLTHSFTVVYIMCTSVHIQIDTEADGVDYIIQCNN